MPSHQPLPITQAAHFKWRVADRVGFVELEPPRAQESADLRVLRGAARPVSRPRLRARCARRGVHRRGREFLLRRRRARDHRPAHADGHAGAARLHAHDGRSGAGDARLPAADRRGGRRRLRGRRRDPRHGLATSAWRRRAARTAFLFTRVGLAGCDMGACAILPRIIGQGRAAELLFTGRAMTAEEGLAWGFFSRLVGPGCSSPRRRAALAAQCAAARRSRTP